jgi:hypothetical protein
MARNFVNEKVRNYIALSEYRSNHKGWLHFRLSFIIIIKYFSKCRSFCKSLTLKCSIYSVSQKRHVILNCM